MVLVEPARDAFGRYKYKDYIMTTQGKIPRKHITKIENVDSLEEDT